MFVALPGEPEVVSGAVSDAFGRGAQIAIVQEDMSSDFSALDLRSGSLPADQVIPQPPFCLLVADSLKALQTIARFWRRKVNARVIAITGSVERSTTKDMIADVLCQRYRSLKNHRSSDFSVNLPLTLLRLGPGHERAVVEMGSNAAGEITALCDLALPAIGVVTNVGRPHAMHTDSLPEIAVENSELVQALPPAPDGIAILNFDDPNVRAMAEKTQAQIFFYGIDPRSDLWADRIESMGLEGIRFRLHFHNESLFMRVPLLGRQSVHTVLRAAAVGLVEGLTWQEIINGLLSGQSQLRLVAVNSQNGALILDDSYDASVESNLAALNLLEEMSGRKVAVLGDMDEFGPYERQGSQMVGVRAAEVCAMLVTVGEAGKKIAEAASQAGMRDGTVKSCAEVAEAIEYLKSKLVPGDVALVKGARELYMDRIVTALEAES
jgi:UDP-N-acetylmuramoyl-tripeptide--D-alanyl-D-alanine ligase